MDQEGLYDLRRYVDRLKTHSILGHDEEAAILALPTRLVQVRRRQDLRHADDTQTCASFVVRGWLARFVQTGSGARQIVTLHTDGEIAGLHHTVHAYSDLSAISDTTLLRIRHDHLDALAARYPRIAAAFWHEAARELAIAHQWLVGIGRQNAQARLSHLFCEMAYRLSSDLEPALSFEFPLTQDELGDVLSLTSIHVNRSLQALKALVTTKLGMVQIHDWAGLQRAGDFNQMYLSSEPVLTGGKRGR